MAIGLQIQFFTIISIYHELDSTEGEGRAMEDVQLLKVREEGGRRHRSQES